MCVCVLNKLKWILKFKIILQGWPHIIFTHFQMCFEILGITHRLFDDFWAQQKQGSGICAWQIREDQMSIESYYNRDRDSSVWLIEWWSQNFDTINWSTEIRDGWVTVRASPSGRVLRALEHRAVRLSGTQHRAWIQSGQRNELHNGWHLSAPLGCHLQCWESWRAPS